MAWAKKKKGSLERGKCGGAWRHLPRPPLGLLRSPIFSQFDPVFCLFFPTAEPCPKLLWCLIMEFSFRAGPIVNGTVIKESLRFILELF